MQRRHHGVVAQIAEQHKALGLVPSQNFRHSQARSTKEAGNAYKRLGVFLRGRRIHDDAAATSGAVYAQVTPKRGISRGDAQAVWQQAMCGRDRQQPSMKSRLALGILPNHRGGSWGGGGGG